MSVFACSMRRPDLDEPLGRCLFCGRAISTDPEVPFCGCPGGRNRVRVLSVGLRTLLEAIARLSEAKGYCPTIRELAAASPPSRTGQLVSTSVVCRRLHRCRELGLVDFDAEQRRTTRLTPAGEALVASFRSGGGAG